MSEKVLFMNVRELHHMQTILDDYSKMRPSYKKFNWYLIKKIDEQAGGRYPHNHTW